MDMDKDTVMSKRRFQRMPNRRRTRIVLYTALAAVLPLFAATGIARAEAIPALPWSGALPLVVTLVCFAACFAATGTAVIAMYRKSLRAQVAAMKDDETAWSVSGITRVKR